MDVQTLVLDVEKHVEQRMPQYIEELRELCSIDTYSYHKSGLDKMARLLAALMGELGLDVEIIERQQWGNDLYGVVHGQGGSNVLAAHSYGYRLFCGDRFCPPSVGGG